MSRWIELGGGRAVAKGVVPVDHCGYMRPKSDALLATGREVGPKPRRSLGQAPAGAH